jgi:hypothetical protein
MHVNQKCEEYMEQNKEELNSINDKICVIQRDIKELKSILNGVRADTGSLPSIESQVGEILSSLKSSEN